MLRLGRHGAGQTGVDGGLSDVALTLEFGRDGNAHTYLGNGWSAGEDGFRWMVGATSELWLEHPGQGRDCILELLLRPFIAKPQLTRQPLSILVRGTEVGRTSLAQVATLGFRIPAAVLDAPGPVRIVLSHPGAAQPSALLGGQDDRWLALSVQSARLWRLPAAATNQPAATQLATTQQAATGRLATDAETPAPTTPDALVMRFESLGDNCEFGLVQRRCGQEPLGLLRFASIELRELLRGVRTAFAGLGDPRGLELDVDAKDGEYVVRDASYGITYHTFQYRDQVSMDGLVAQQSVRLKFLVRKLMEDVRTAEKIFVVKRNKPLTEADILPLYASLRAAAGNILLWVEPADPAHPPGSVEAVLPGLLKGYVARFAPPENAYDLDLESWLAVCAAAWRLVSGTDAAGDADEMVLIRNDDARGEARAAEGS